MTYLSTGHQNKSRFGIVRSSIENVHILDKTIINNLAYDLRGRSFGIETMVEFGLYHVSLNLLSLYFTYIGMTKTYEPRHEKTNILHMRKQRRRSASR